MNRLCMFGLCGALAAALSVAVPASAQSEKVVLNMASAFPGSLLLLGSAATKLPAKVERASGGTLELKFFEPGALVPAAESVNAVSAGSVDAAWAGAGWFAGRDSAFNMFSSVPFGPGIGEYLAWMYEAGGLDLAREMFAKENVYNIPCSITAPETSGWFRKEIKSVDDLKGLKMRFFGLGAKVMEKLGVATQQLPAGDIFPALQMGTIDATEFSLPALDQKLGFYQVAKYNYFPGWHQQATLYDVYVNLDVWNKLSDQHQAVLEMACADQIREGISLSEGIEGKALNEMKAAGVEIKVWPPEMLAAFEKAWNEVVEEEKAKNPSFAKVWASYSAFRDEYAVWREHAYLK